MARSMALLRPILVLSVLIVVITLSTIATANDGRECAKLLEGREVKKPLIKFDPKTFEYRGLTPEGLNAFGKVQQRQQLRNFPSDTKQP